MPRKTKEQKDVENIKNIEKELKKLVEKKPAKKAKEPAKAKKTESVSKAKKSAEKPTKDAKKVATKSTSKKTANTKKVTTSKKDAKNTKKTASTKKIATKKATSVKKDTTKKTTTTKKTSTKTKKPLADIVEYYDLPYRYNQTVVKVLAQTPTNLFIYWDISDADRENYKKEYGDNFFETTKPVLIIHNDTLNYSFEIDINDFANSWYLQVNDAKCDYRIELGRRPITYNEKIKTDYIYVSTSNEIESPNDRILFNKDQKMVYFRDVKTGVQTSKPITSFSFIRNMGKIYNIYDIYDMYKELYKDENIEEIYDLSNPSSGNPSSRKSFIKI